MEVELKNSKILVTGGAGFIGSRVVKKLLEMGSTVRVVDNLSKGEASNLSEVTDKIEFIKADLLEKHSAENALKGMDACFHFAALIGGIGYFHKYPATSVRDNTIMNLNLWDAARKAKPKMICVSSSMVFERTKTFPTPESAVTQSPPPLTGYGFSKLTAEYIARTYNEEFDIPFVIARPFNAYGPGEGVGDYVGYSHVIPDLMKKILEGQYPVEILGDGSQTRSYTHVDDVADGIIFAASRAENDDFNIGNGTENTVNELAKTIWDACSMSKPLKTVSLKPFKYDVKKRVPDISKLFSLGWRPKISLEEGIALTLEWFRNKNKI